MKRARTVIPVVICAVAIGALLIGGLSRNVVYFRTVSEAVDTRAADGADRFRMAGAVAPGTVRTAAGEVIFDLTDGLATVTVRHRGDPPELFEDGAPVVSEGSWSGTDFASDRLMIKHGSDYAPPDQGTPQKTPSDRTSYDEGTS